VRLIAGDFNLVGTRTPLDAMRAGLDADGSELAVAQTDVLGDHALYTWSDHKTEFPDGRLDYLIYSDASADAANAFVLDTRRLSDRTLAKLGLDRTDTGASDHLPVVVDLMPKK
jgi:endonuclease/exonuclease/phosphatase family metal-dependent hydrolase